MYTDNQRYTLKIEIKEALGYSIPISQAD